MEYSHKLLILLLALSLQVHGFWLVQDAVMTLLSRDEVCPRSSLSLALAGTTLDPLAELQSLKGLKPGAILRLVEGSITLYIIHIITCQILILDIYIQRLFRFIEKLLFFNNLDV